MRQSSTGTYHLNNALVMKNEHAIEDASTNEFRLVVGIDDFKEGQFGVLVG